jgi:hypothetical protein
MSSDNNPPDGVRPNRKLPPEFQFLVNLPDLREFSGDELHVWIEEHFAKIRQKAAVLLEHGVAAERLIAYLEPSLRDLEKTQRAVDEAELKQFHAQADLGDSRYNLFKCMDALVKEACETNPLDPQVQELKEYVDEWRKHMPKE